MDTEVPSEGSVASEDALCQQEDEGRPRKAAVKFRD